MRGRGNDFPFPLLQKKGCFLVKKGGGRVYSFSLIKKKKVGKADGEFPQEKGILAEGEKETSSHRRGGSHSITGGGKADPSRRERIRKKNSIPCLSQGKKENNQRPAKKSARTQGGTGRASPGKKKGGGTPTPGP